jgi:hypothetical protein
MTLLESCLCWGDCCDGTRTGELVVVVVMVMVRAGYLPMKSYSGVRNLTVRGFLKGRIDWLYQSSLSGFGS